MDVEGGLISSVVLRGELNKALERRVTNEFFTDPQHKRVWEYIVNHYTTYGVTPDEAVVLQAYPAYELFPQQQTTDYFIEQVAKRRRLAILLNGINDAVAASQDKEDPDRDAKVQSIMQAALFQTNLETADAITRDYTPALSERMKAWRSGPGAAGISYGLPTLDSLTGGLKPQQFVVLTGLPKTRKSWTELFIASTVHVLGWPVAFLTFEMSNEEQLERLATLWAKVPYSMVRDKTLLTDAHVKSVEKAVRMRSALHPFLGIEDTAGHSTVSSLMAFVKDREIAVLFIDGIYLMTDERTNLAGHEGTQPLSNISRDLKRLAKSANISVVATTQTLFSKTKAGKTNLHGMGYTSAFSQDADVIIGVEVDDLPEVTTMRMLGNRSGPQGVSFQVRWDLDNGLVEEMGALDPNDEGATYGDVG